MSIKHLTAYDILSWWNPQHVGYRRNIPQCNKEHIWQTKANIILNSERLKAFSLIIKKKGCLLPHLFNIVVEVLARTTRWDKEVKDILNRKEEVRFLFFTEDMIFFWYRKSHRFNNNNNNNKPWTNQQIQ